MLSSEGRRTRRTRASYRLDMRQHSRAQEAELLLMSNKLFAMSRDWGMLEKEIGKVVEE